MSKGKWGVIALIVVGMVAVTGCGDSKSSETGGGGGTSSQPSNSAGSSDSMPAEGPEGFMGAFKGAMSGKGLGGLWHVLPASYQADLNGVAQSFGKNIDPEVHSKAAGVVRGLVDVLKNKKQFVLGSGMVKGLDADGQLASGYDSIVGLLDSVASSEIFDREKLANLDVQNFLSGSGNKIARGLVGLMDVAASAGGDELEKFKSMQQATLTRVSESDGKIVCKIQVPGEEDKETTFVKVENKWLPEDMVKDWSKSMAEMKKTASEKMSPGDKAKALGMMGMVEGLVSGFKGANSQAEFDTALQQAMDMMGGGVPGMGGR